MNKKQNMYLDCEAITGTCKSMCPLSEAIMREKAGMVHKLEVSRNGKKELVKCYSRSVADSVVAAPHLLRPADVLFDTLQHLLVTKRNDVITPVIYDFVDDRLRAVRQDMTIQRLLKSDCLRLLEPMIRFYVYFGYKLCQHPIEVYDPVLNKQHLLECLKWYFVSYKAIEQPGTENEFQMILVSASNWEDLPEYRPFLSGVRQTLGRPKPKTKYNRELMESLYILSNLDSNHPISRYWTLSKELQSISKIKLSHKIAVANLMGNYIQVIKQLENLCPLTFCALSVHLPALQRQALLVMSAAYSSKQLSVPLCAIRRWLGFNSDDEVRRVCTHYGLATVEGHVKFLKSNFLPNAALHQPIKPLQQEKKMNLSIDNVFSYLIVNGN